MVDGQDIAEAIAAASTGKKRGSWDESIRTVLLALVLAMVFRSFLFEPFHIPSGSMKSNLLIGDYLFVSKYSYGYSRYSFPFGLPLFEGRLGSSQRPERGDVVVFRPPGAPRVDYIKRVIGMPGDTIQLTDGVVYINGEPLPRNYLGEFTDDDAGDNFNMKLSLKVAQYSETLPEGKIITILKGSNDREGNNTGVFVVPPKHYFMMGDNRDNSRDSRFEVGFVPEENLVGRAEMIWFSWGDGSLRMDRFFKRIE